VLSFRMGRRMRALAFWVPGWTARAEAERGAKDNGKDLNVRKMLGSGYSRNMKFSRSPQTSITSPSLSRTGPWIGLELTSGVLSPGPI
jgi:hypothetical protein